MIIIDNSVNVFKDNNPKLPEKFDKYAKINIILAC